MHRASMRFELRSSGRAPGPSDLGPVAGSGGRDRNAFKRWARRVAIGLVGLYVLLTLGLYVFQRKLFYSPDPASYTAAEQKLEGFRDVVISTSDGEKLRGFYKPAAPGRVTILYFHGSRGAIPTHLERMKTLAAPGNGLLWLCYRGYSGSTGTPTEQGLTEDSRASYDWLSREARGGKIALYGESLGTAVAVRLAAEKPVAGVVLDAAFTTAAETMAVHLPMFPITLLMKDQYRSIDKIQEVHAPLLFLHGEKDWNVPLAMGQKMFQLAREPKRFVQSPEGEHGDNLENATAEVLQFFRSLE
jgi:uncharacterized protein